jgi:hypothetical protein
VRVLGRARILVAVAGAVMTALVLAPTSKGVPRPA